MRDVPRMIAGVVLLMLPVACTEAPQFMKEERKSGAVIFAGQFAQGSMFRDNDAPASAYYRPGMATTSVPSQPGPVAPSLAERSPKPTPVPIPARRISVPPSPI